MQPTNWSSGQIGSGSIPRGNSNGSAAMDGTTPLTGVNQRTLTLSNGAIIWDLAGNVWEWTDVTILGRDQPVSPSPSTWNYYEYTSLLSYGTLSPERLLPLNSSWNSTQGYGRAHIRSVATDMTTYAFLRGGYWYNGTSAGVLALRLAYETSYTYSRFGFRCAQ